MFRLNNIPSYFGSIWGLLVVAVVLCTANAVKPLHIDDTYLYFLAEHISKHPLDPFGLEIFWQNWPHPAHESFVPPVLPFWIAGAMAAFGDSLLAWKLSLFPIMLLFVWALRELGRRFASPLGEWAVPLVALSPACLPSWNLMLDLPAVAFGLASVAVFLTALDRERLWGAVIAGLLAALATQTKYNLLVVPVVFATAGVLCGRWRLTLVSLMVWLGAFAAWEGFVAVRYGQSQFLWASGNGVVNLGWNDRWLIALSMLRYIGLLLPAVAVLVLSSLLQGRASLILALVGTGLGGWAYYAMSIPGWLDANGWNIVLPVVAILLLPSLFNAIQVLKRTEHAETGYGARGAALVLSAWLVLDVTIALVTAPFGATRRIIPLAVVLTLISLRFVAARVTFSRANQLLLVATAGNLLLAGLYYQTDLDEARAQSAMPSVVMAGIRAQEQPGRVWFVGHWGFAYYARKEGMVPIVPEQSYLRPGDWVVVPHGVDRQSVNIDPGRFRRLATVTYQGDGRYSTVPWYYAGFSPISGRTEPRGRAAVYRVVSGHVAEIGYTLPELVDWVRRRIVLPSTAQAIPALIRHLGDEIPEYRQAAAESLALFGRRAQVAIPYLNQIAEDPDSRVRKAVAESIAAIQVGHAGKQKLPL